MNSENIPLEDQEAVNKELESSNQNPSESQAEKHMEEIDTSNAVADENELEIEETDKTVPFNYSKLNIDQLVEILEKLVKSDKINTVTTQINQIKKSFNDKYKKLLEAKKSEFIENGGNEIDFYYSSDTKKRFNTAVRNYKESIAHYYEERKKRLADNFQQKNEIINGIKGLISVDEDIQSTYKKFNELREQWRKTGPIAKEKYSNTWRTYQFHVERFYDFMDLNRDLRDLDFKHNLEKKTKLIEKAEALAQTNDIHKAFRELQTLHKVWKEELGPVSKEHRELIWQRFSQATKVIHDKRQVYFDQKDIINEENWKKKQSLIEQINELTAHSEKINHKEWQNRMKTIADLKSKFFDAGPVPRSKNKSTWNSFKESVRTFNQQKNNFYKSLKTEQNQNLNKKIQLIEIAEQNMESDDFEVVTPLMKKIQNEWKKVGHVPRKNSNEVWDRFKKACNHYFDRLHYNDRAEKPEMTQAFEAKKTVLEKLQKMEVENGNENHKEQVKTLMGEWLSLGVVSRDKQNINSTFEKVFTTKLKKIGLSNLETEEYKYDLKINSLRNKDDQKYFISENNFVRNKIQDLKGEINQLENNLQFFSNAQANNPVIVEVKNKIDKSKENLQLWEYKLSRIKKLK